MKTTEARKHNHYSMQDCVVDVLMVICGAAGVYGLLSALGFGS